MHMRMFSVEVGNRDPVQRRSHVMLYPRHEVARQASKVRAFTEFG